MQYRVTHLRGTSEVAAAGSNGKRALSLPRPAAVRGALVVKGPVCTGASLRHEYAGRRRDVEGGALVHHSSIRHGIEPRLSPLPPTQALSRLQQDGSSVASTATALANHRTIKTDDERELNCNYGRIKSDDEQLSQLSQPQSRRVIWF